MSDRDLAAEGRIELAMWKALHRCTPGHDPSLTVPWCVQCVDPWPCPTARLIGAVEALLVPCSAGKSCGDVRCLHQQGVLAKLAEGSR